MLTPEGCVEGELVEVGNLPKKKILLAQIVTVYLIFNITFIIIFTALSIGDYSAKVNFNFASIPFQTQFLLIGVVLIALSFIIILYGVMYRHGRNAVLKSLYGKCKPPPTPHEYLLFNVIIKGFIGCILVTFAGLMIELIVFIVSAITSSTRYGLFTINQQMLLFWILLFTGVCLYLLVSFIWKNGFRYFINRLIQVNARFHSHAELNERRVKLSWAVYGVVLAAFGVCIIGLYLIIVEGISAGHGWSYFILAPWELQIAWVGACGMFISGFLILTMFINQRTLVWVQNTLFIRPLSKAGPGKGASTRLASITLFLGIFLIFVGAIMWGFTLVIQDIFGIQIAEFLTTFSEGTVGYIIFVWGFLFFISVVIALIFIFFINNGFTFIMKEVGKTEAKVEEKIGGISFHKGRDTKVQEQESKGAYHPAKPYIKPGAELSKELSEQLRGALKHDTTPPQDNAKVTPPFSKAPAQVSPKPASPTPAKSPSQAPKTTTQAQDKTKQEDPKEGSPEQNSS